MYPCSCRPSTDCCSVFWLQVVLRRSSGCGIFHTFRRYHAGHLNKRFILTQTGGRLVIYLWCVFICIFRGLHLPHGGSSYGRKDSEQIYEYITAIYFTIDANKFKSP